MRNLGWVIRYVDDDLRKVTPQRLTNQIEMFEVNPLCYLMVNLIYGGWTDAREPGKVGLHQAQLSGYSLQINLNHAYAALSVIIYRNSIDFL